MCGEIDNTARVFNCNFENKAGLVFGKFGPGLYQLVVYIVYRLDTCTLYTTSDIICQKADSGRFGPVVTISACRGPGAPSDKASYTLVQKLSDHF